MQTGHYAQYVNHLFIIENANSYASHPDDELSIEQLTKLSFVNCQLSILEKVSLQIHT